MSLIYYREFNTNMCLPHDSLLLHTGNCFTDPCFTLRQCGEKKVVGAACWGHSPWLKMSVRDGAATMVTSVAGGGGGGRPASPNNHDGRSYLLQIYPRLAAQPTACCSLRWGRSSTTAATVQVLHFDKLGKFQLADWNLTDKETNRLQKWPNKPLTISLS